MLCSPSLQGLPCTGLVVSFSCSSLRIKGLSIKACTRPSQGRDYLFPCSPEINRFVPLLPKTKILISYVPCFPKIAFAPLFPSFSDICYPEINVFVPLFPKPTERVHTYFHDQLGKAHSSTCKCKELYGVRLAPVVLFLYMLTSTRNTSSKMLYNFLHEHPTYAKGRSIFIFV